MARKLKYTETECDAIKCWLKNNDNNQVKLASRLGLKSTNVLVNWLARGRVSKHKIEKVREICNVNATQ